MNHTSSMALKIAPMAEKASDKAVNKVPIEIYFKVR